MKIALLFPGYGDQYVGMGKDLYDEYRIVQEYFEEASNCVPINFVKLCFASSDAELSRLFNAYSSLFLTNIAVFFLLKEQGIHPQIVSGYNNGEIAAMCAAGCFSFPDGLYLISKMCALYEGLLHNMDVEIIRLYWKAETREISLEYIKNICNDLSDEENSLHIILYDSAHDCILSGTAEKIKQLRDILEEQKGGAYSIEFLSTEIGLHSSLMNTVIDQFKMYLEKVDFKDVMTPVMSNLDGQLITEGAELKNRFLRLINEPLHFNKVIEKLDLYEIILVITPAESLVKKLKKEYPDKTIVAITKKSDIEILKEIIQIHT
jgi:[acyl-carrier-protein] S-malonyltransferase